MATGFPINPPRAMLTDGAGFVSPPWYRYFAQIQNAVGSSTTATWQDGYLLAAAPPVPPSIDELQAGGAAVALRVVTITADRFLESTDAVIRGDATTASLLVILTSAALTPGRTLWLKKIDASVNTVAFAATGGELIDGAATLSIGTQYQSYTIVSNGTGWDIV